MKRGLLIAFEGVDGAGKSTQARRLAARLEALGHEVIMTYEPTDGPWGRQIREAARVGRRMPPEAELDAFLRDRRQHVEELICPGLEAGRIILTDRYYFSTMAYQSARGFDPTELQARNEAFAPAPDLLIYLRVDIEEGLRRISDRGVADAFERAETLRTAAAVFDGLALPYLLRLEARAPIEAIEAAIWRRVEALTTA